MDKNGRYESCKSVIRVGQFPWPTVRNGWISWNATWNRQALDYVERYDPATDTWTNLSKLPVAMFGWGGTVLNDEIVLVGGYNGGTKKTVYHWNPVEDTWSQGNNI